MGVGTDKHAVANNGFMLIGAIIVTGNGTSADIHIIANFGIAQVAQMACFRAFTQTRFFYLHEITDVSAFRQFCARA
ncbi:hypothetical protein D3C80_1850200 [compost metagenome]